ncbi:MAG: hypothetical protein WKF31_10945 [Thermoleophilaceae bacterium]
MHTTTHVVQRGACGELCMSLTSRETETAGPGCPQENRRPSDVCYNVSPMTRTGTTIALSSALPGAARRAYRGWRFS